MRPELIFYNGRRLTEGLYYRRETDELYFVAIRDNLIGVFSPETGRVKTYATDGPVGGAIPGPDGTILAAEKKGIFRIDPETGGRELLIHIIQNPRMRYNHLLQDAKGRILVDVMGDEERAEGKGGLYAIEGERVRPLILGTTVANGLALSKDGTRLYFTDTPTKTVEVYDYDVQTGGVANGRILLTLPGPGLPDGLCVDEEDFLWVTEWAGGRVCRYNSLTGEKVGEVTLPCSHVTSCCTGGGWLYIATAKCGQYPEAPAGGIFRIRL